MLLWGKKEKKKGFPFNSILSLNKQFPMPRQIIEFEETYFSLQRQPEFEQQKFLATANLV